MWCVTRTLAGAVRSLENCAKRRKRSSRPPTSNPAAGSSNRSNSGSAINAREIKTRFFSPELKVEYLLSPSSRTPNVVNKATARDSSHKS